MKFNPNKIIDETDFFNRRKCKRCDKSLDGMRSDAIYCSRNCKSIVRKCNKSRLKTIEKWKSKELEKINFQKLLEGGK
jgi:hypothetical protein